MDINERVRVEEDTVCISTGNDLFKGIYVESAGKAPPDMVASYIKSAFANAEGELKEKLAAYQGLLASAQAENAELLEALEVTAQFVEAAMLSEQDSLMQDAIRMELQKVRAALSKAKGEDNV